MEEKSIVELGAEWRAMNAFDRWRLVKPFVPTLFWTVLAMFAFVSILVCFKFSMATEFESLSFLNLSSRSWLSLMAVSGMLLCVFAIKFLLSLWRIERNH